MNDKTFQVSVDGEPVVIPRKDVTPAVILSAAGFQPEDRYLIEIEGQKKTSYRDNPNSEIRVHENQLFITARLAAVGVA